MSTQRLRRSHHQFFAIFLILTLTLITQTTHADYQTGLDEYNKGHYKTAMYEWKAVSATPPGTYLPTIYAETYYAIGMLYWFGQDVLASYLEASQWLQKAADLGHSGAQAKLGYLYTQGIAVPQSYETAFQWFSESAKQGNVDGQYNLGIFYLNGWATEQDKTMAAQYLAAASAQGDKEAEAALQSLLPTLTNKSKTPTPKTLPAKSTVIPAKAGTSINLAEPKINNPKQTPAKSTVIPAKAGTSQSSQSVNQSPSPKINPQTWIQAQNPNHYTIQVIGLRTIAALETLIQGHNNLAPFATYTLERNNKPLHLLVQGVYPDVESARKARDKFPSAIQKPKNTWIRQFIKIQEIILAEQTAN